MVKILDKFIKYDNCLIVQFVSPARTFRAMNMPFDPSVRVSVRMVNETEITASQCQSMLDQCESQNGAILIVISETYSESLIALLKSACDRNISSVLVYKQLNVSEMKTIRSLTRHGIKFISYFRFLENSSPSGLETSHLS